jgi:hypothetical protein
LIYKFNSSAFLCSVFALLIPIFFLNKNAISCGLNVYKKTAETYIDTLRPTDEKEIHTSRRKSKKKMMTIDRIIHVVSGGTDADGF